MPSARRCIPGLLLTAAMACLSAMPSRCEDLPKAAVDDDLSFAICPIVYPLEQSPSDRGFHYLFYGNGFFVNDQGYLVTAAHVLSQLSDAPPYVVLRLPMAPPRLLKADIIAIDRDHDVAVLRVTPNPFAGKYQVRFLPLDVEQPTAPQNVLAAALRPSRLKDPHTFDAFAEDRPAGQVLSYEFSQLEKGSPQTQLLLFAHEVLLGDSGAPVISTQSNAVVGLIEGRWLRVNATSLVAAARSGGVGAAVPIHYAISLLEHESVVWHAARKQASDVAPASGPQEARSDQRLHGLAQSTPK